MICKRGHEFRGDENYRARQGWCPVCFRETQARYDRTAKGKKRHLAYNHSDQGWERNSRFKQSPAGWRLALEERRSKALRRRARRVNNQEAEDSSG